MCFGISIPIFSSHLLFSFPLSSSLTSFPCAPTYFSSTKYHFQKLWQLEYHYFYYLLHHYHLTTTPISPLGSGSLNISISTIYYITTTSPPPQYPVLSSGSHLPLSHLSQRTLHHASSNPLPSLSGPNNSFPLQSET